LYPLKGERTVGGSITTPRSSIQKLSGADPVSIRRPPRSHPDTRQNAYYLISTRIFPRFSPSEKAYLRRSEEASDEAKKLATKRKSEEASDEAKKLATKRKSEEASDEAKKRRSQRRSKEASDEAKKRRSQR